MLITGLHEYCIATTDYPGLVIGFGKARVRQIAPGIVALAEAYDIATT